MGSSRNRRNSNSANGARSVQKSSKRRSKLTKPRTAADALRAIKHARSPQSAEPLQMNRTQAVREMRDGVPATALRYIRKKLALIQSTAIVVAHALREQRVGLDDDGADVLRRRVSDELQDQIEGIDSLLGGVS
jgi:hypothetical protein